ncbi:MAG: phage tail protein, partial [Nocardioides sp.]
MSAYRWLAHGDWATATQSGTVVTGGRLMLAPGTTTSYLRRGVAVLRAGRPDPAQVDTTTADRWRSVAARLSAPVPETSWLRLWTRVEVGNVTPPAPEPATALSDDAPALTPAGVWRAAPAGAVDARVLCPADGVLWVAVELGGLGAATPAVVDLLVETGDDGPVTELPLAYRDDPSLGTDGVDGGDGLLGRYLGLLGARVRQTSSLLGELPASLSPAVAPNRGDAPWLTRLATWVALDPARLPSADAERRETVATAVMRHGWRGTRRGLLDQVRRETGLAVEVVEPLQRAAVWRLDADPQTSALGLTTGLVPADPGPPVLDRTALLDASMLVGTEEAGLPVHAHLAHRVCVHVPGGSAADVAAVDAVV